MPELPDVEILARYYRSHAQGKRVQSICVCDDRIVEESSQRLGLLVTGRPLKEAHRHGKYLLIAADENCHLIFHFGMTGYFVFLPEENHAPESQVMRICFEDGSHLSYCSKRRLGRVSITRSRESLIQREDLGPDALRVSKQDFVEAFADVQGAVKTALMKQERLAGIGNVYSDEVLFHAGLHPKASSRSLKEEDWENLHSKLQYVLKKAIDFGAVPTKAPRTWLLPRRKEGETCGRCGAAICRDSIASRGFYYCPQCQPLS